MQELELFLRHRKPDAPLVVDAVDDGDAFVISYERDLTFDDGTWTFLSDDGVARIRVTTRYNNVTLEALGSSWTSMKPILEVGASRHVITVIKNSAQVDLHMNGRFIVGFGAGKDRPGFKIGLIGGEDGSGNPNLLLYKLAIFKGTKAKEDAEHYVQNLSQIYDQLDPPMRQRAGQKYGFFTFT